MRIEQAINKYGEAMFDAGRQDMYDDLGPIVVTDADRKRVSARIAKAKANLMEAAAPRPDAVTDAMVEAGAKAIWDNAFPGKQWDAGLKEIYCADARLAIEAALAAAHDREAGPNG